MTLEMVHYSEIWFNIGRTILERNFDVNLETSRIKTEFILIIVYKFTLYLTGNTLRSGTKTNRLKLFGETNAVYWRTIRNTQIHFVGIV
jgi:hypothetical protein